MAQALSRLMLRRGRRPGLQLGYAIAAVGGLIAALGAERGELAVFVVGLFLFGGGQASNLLARYAATDLAEPAHRGRAMSQVVFASTFGAVFGPLLIAPAQHAGEAWFGFDRYTGPWLFGGLCFATGGDQHGGPPASRPARRRRRRRRTRRDQPADPPRSARHLAPRHVPGWRWQRWPSPKRRWLP